MTDTSPVSPQSPTAPAETNVKRDEFSGIMTTEYEATADQRVLGIGNTVPLVFCKANGQQGGTWVTPPAGRYGTTQNPRDGDSFAFGMVISDGQIGAIANADIYKGAVKAETLASPRIEFRYNGMPEAGFDYTLKSVEPGDPAIPGVPGYWGGFEQRGEYPRWRLYKGQTASVSGSNAVSADVKIAMWGFIKVWIYVDGQLVGGKYDFYFKQAPNWTWSGQFSRGTIEVKVQLYPEHTTGGSNPSHHADIHVDLVYQQQQWVPAVPEIPATPDTTTNLPLFPGSGGNYQGMSCLAVAGKYPAGIQDTVYRQQVRCFVRNGVYVTNLLTGAVGPSNLFPDLVYYLIDKATQAGTKLIDVDSFKRAAAFCQAQGLLFNGVLANSVNLRAYLSRVAPLFLLGFVQEQGKYTLKPLLPLTSSNQISASTVQIKHRFTAEDIVAGSYSKSYVDSNKREPFCALMTWRAQHEALFGVSKSTEVRYRGTAVDGPYEQYDLEEFCDNQEHAVLVGKFILAGRKHSTHLVEFQAVANISTLGPLDFIEVEWKAETTLGSFDSGIVTYQVQSITESAEGFFSISAAHFPVTADGESLIARDTVSDDFEIK